MGEGAAHWGGVNKIELHRGGAPPTPHGPPTMGNPVKMIFLFLDDLRNILKKKTKWKINPYIMVTDDTGWKYQLFIYYNLLLQTV